MGLIPGTDFVVRTFRVGTDSINNFVCFTSISCDLTFNKMFYVFIFSQKFTIFVSIVESIHLSILICPARSSYSQNNYWPTHFLKSH